MVSVRWCADRRSTYSWSNSNFLSNSKAIRRHGRRRIHRHRGGKLTLYSATLQYSPSANHLPVHFGPSIANGLGNSYFLVGPKEKSINGPATRGHVLLATSICRHLVALASP